MDGDTDLDKKDVRRPMNAFLIFCKRHRAMVRERNPHLDNRSVTRILGDLWANIGDDEKVQYTDLAKQYKDAFMRANPDYKWHNPERINQSGASCTAKPNTKPSDEKTTAIGACLSGVANPIVLGKLADPSNMGGLSSLMEGSPGKSHQFNSNKKPIQTNKPVTSPSITGQQALQQWQTQQEITYGEEKSMNLEHVKIEQNLDEAQNLSIKQEPKVDFVEPVENLLSSVTHGNQEKSNIEDDSSIYSCGKMVMDHIINKLYLSTFKNVEGNQNSSPVVLPTDAGMKNQEPVRNTRVSDLPAEFIPPSQGRKSYHTSIAVRNLLEFTRKATAQQEEANIRSAGQATAPKVENEAHFMSETKQRLKDFCLKKESRPRVQTTISKPAEPCEVKEYTCKRKRCYSESIAEFYKSQEKRIKIESGQFDNSGGESRMSRDEDFQPTRKSRRRNRGQKYQELINEGIIQPSKARLAAMKTDTTSFRGINFKESFLVRRTEDLGDDVLSVYPRQIRKRTMSESEKNRSMFDESARYRTGDFDLEAHIKTLPACSIDKVVKPKRVIGRTNSESEPGSAGIESSSSKLGAKEVKLSVPPHIKVRSSETSVPVVGSRKRKARKHSITHLQPVKTNTGASATLLSGVIHQRLSTEKLVEDSSSVPMETDENTVKDIASENENNNFCTNSTTTEDFKKKVVNNSSMENNLVGLETTRRSEHSKDKTNSGNNFCNVDDSKDMVDSDKITAVMNDKVPLADLSSADFISNKISNGATNISDSTNIVKETNDKYKSDVHFTKLKNWLDCKPTKTDSCDSSKEILSASSSDGSSGADKHTMDQDENSNDPDYVCKITTDVSASNISGGEEIPSLSEELRNSICDNEHLPKLTAVSVAIPVTKEETKLTENREPDILKVTVSSVSECSSAVAMTNMQPSLTCLC